jgi:hypothetical protein
MSRAHGRKELSGLDRYWNRLTDEELLATNFTTSDPESLPGLVHALPPAEPLPIVELAYDFRGTGHARLRCVHCNRPIHLAGFVLRTPDERRFLVGHNCGEEIYGAEFNALRRHFEAKRNRASLLKRMRNLHAALPAFNETLAMLRRHPSVSAFRDFRTGFAKNHARLYGALEMAYYNDAGNLIIFNKVRDPDAEKRADAQYQIDLANWKARSKSQRKHRYARPEPPAKPIFRTVVENAGRLPASTFFTTKAFSPTDYHALLTQLEQLSSSAEADERFLSLYETRARLDRAELSYCKSTATDAFMAQVLFQTNELLRRLEEQIQKLAEPIRLFRAPVLHSLCRWANTKLPNEYAVVGHVIAVTDPFGHVDTLGLPKGFVVPPLDGIEAFRAAINSEQ